MVKVKTDRGEVDFGNPDKPWAYEAAEYLLAHPNELSTELLTQLIESLIREQSSRLNDALITIQHAISERRK